MVLYDMLSRRSARSSLFKRPSEGFGHRTPPIALQLAKPQLIKTLPAEVLMIVIEALSASSDPEDPLGDLMSLAFTCKELYKLATIEIYRNIIVYAPRTLDRRLSNLEQLARTFANNTRLAQLVERLAFDQFEEDIPWGRDMRDNLNYSLVSDDKPGSFFNGQDTHRAIKYITSLTVDPIFNDCPSGVWDPDSLLNCLNFDIRGTDMVKDRNKIAWIRHFKAGNQLALIALVIAKCQYAKHILINEWHTIQSLITRIHRNHPGAMDMGVDSDFVAMIMRGGINTTRTLRDTVPLEKQGAWMQTKHGLLYRLEKIDMITDSQMAEGLYKLPLRFMLPYLSSPVLKKAWLSIVDNNTPNEIAHLPLHVKLGERLRELVLDVSHMNTNDLLMVIDRTQRLDTFAYNHTFVRGFDNGAYDHVRVIKALGKKHGETLTVVRFKCDFGDGAYYGDAFGELEQVMVDNWKDYKVVQRLEIPPEYLVGWRRDDVKYFDQYMDDGFNIASVDMSYMDLDTPLREQFSSTLKLLEIPWPKAFLPRWSQIYSEMNSWFLELKDGLPVPQLKTLIIGREYGTLMSGINGPRAPKELLNMMDSATGIFVGRYIEGGEDFATDNEMGVNLDESADVVEVDMAEVDESYHHDDQNASEDDEDAADMFMSDDEMENAP